jgi:hypothetical protein
MYSATRSIASPLLPRTHGGIRVRIQRRHLCTASGKSSSALRLGFGEDLKQRTGRCGRAHCASAEPRLVASIGQCCAPWMLPFDCLFIAVVV